MRIQSAPALLYASALIIASFKFLPRINQNIKILDKIDFHPFKNSNDLFAMTAHILFTKIDSFNVSTHSKLVIREIRNRIGFKNIIITDDISMKALRYDIENNTKKAFTAGCNLVLHCNANLKEMEIVANNSPFLSKFILKKTSQFYKILS